MNKNRNVVVLLILGSLVACGTTGRIDIYPTCDDPCGNGMPGYTCGMPCKTCTGDCMSLPPLGFSNPVLLWIGGEKDFPGCPEDAPQHELAGYADPDDSYQCPACQCDKPSCELPSGLQTSASLTCEGPDFGPFEGPDAWRGACASPTTVTSSELSSILIPPPEVGACAPRVESISGPLYLVSPWRTFAHGCKGEAVPGVCGDPGKTCVPKQDSAPGFSQCILYLREGDTDCPVEYPEKHVFYDSLQDERGCTACTCGPPEDSTCTVLVSAYEDQRCTMLLGAVTLTLDEPKCLGGPGLELGSMEAKWITNEPGSCAPLGGERTGQLIPQTDSVYCCATSLQGEAR